MKKHALLSFMLFMATSFAWAQIQISIPATMPASSINATDVTWFNTVTGVTGFYDHRYIYKAAGDTVFTEAPIHTENGTDFMWPLYGLMPMTTYTLASVAIDTNGVTDTSQYRVFTTDSLPGVANQFTIHYLGIDTGPLQTKYRFHFESAYLIGAKAYQDMYSGSPISSPILFLQGVGDTSIVAPSNVPNTLHNDNFIYANSVAPILGVSDTFMRLPNYRVPQAGAGVVVSMVVPSRGQTSLSVSVHAKPGNTGSAVVFLKWKRNGVLIETLPQFSIYRDTTFGVSKNNFPHTNTAYTLVAEVVSGGGSGIDSITSLTLEVLPPIFITADTTNATTAKTDFRISFDTDGSWDSSASRVWVEYKDRNNVMITTPISAYFVGPSNIIVGPLSNLKAGDEGANSATIWIQNAAGMKISRQISFYIASRRPAVPVLWGHLTGNVRRINVDDIGVTASTSNPVDVIALVQRAQSQTVDTVGLYINFTGTLSTTNRATIGGLDPVVYNIRIATRNYDGIWYINSQVKPEEPIPGIDGIHTIAPSAITVNGTHLTYTASGNGNGNDVYWNTFVRNYDTSTDTAAKYTEFAGNVSFTKTHTVTNLLPYTHYVFVSTINDAYTGQIYGDPIEYEFWTTDVTTGITDMYGDEVQLTYNSEVELYNLTLLQREGTGKYGEFAKKFSGNGFIYTVRPLEEKLAKKYGTKKVMFK